jgi:hypothetical protein
MMVAQSDPVSDPAPGAELLPLAEEYREAALTLLRRPDGGGIRGPGRFCALHAIELYLDAFLRRAGQPSGRLRLDSHNLGARAALAIQAGLALRRKTALHLVTLTRSREYLAARYRPGAVAEACELNRLAATLDEIAREVAAAVTRLNAPAPDAAALHVAPPRPAERRPA